MSGFKEPSLSDRQKAAVNARKAALERFRARPRPGDPAFEQQQADRKSDAAERTVARNARAAEKAEKKARTAEAAEHAAQAAAKKIASDLAEIKAREAARQVEQKVARDKRYAARKARKK
jgi:hypothetical protein